MSSIPPISHCIGDYDAGDTICDGDGAADLPCSWRDRCAAFRRHLRTSDEDIEKYLAPKAISDGGEETIVAEPVGSLEQFAKFCDQLIRVESRSKKRKKARKKRKRAKDKTYDKRRNGPTAIVKLAAKKALRKRAQEHRQVLMSMFGNFKAELVGHLDGRELATAGQVIAPGQLFVMDHVDTSSYVSLYCQTAQGWNVPLIVLRLKTTTSTFDIRLPVEVKVLKERLSKTTFKKLSPTPIEDGRFKAEVLKVGKMELALLAESIAQLVDGGIIVLPVR